MYIASVPTIECVSPGMYIVGSLTVECKSRDVYHWSAHFCIRVQECILLERLP